MTDRRDKPASSKPARNSPARGDGQWAVQKRGTAVTADTACSGGGLAAQAIV